MNDLIRKIAIKTVIIVLATLAVIFGGLTLFVPKIMADEFYDYGWTEFSANYSEIVYKRNKSVNNLAILVERGIEVDNSRIITTYAKKLLEHEKFEEYASQKPTYVIVKDEKGNESFSYDFSYKDAVSSKYAVTLYKKRSNADDLTFFDVAKKYTDSYGNSNPLRSLMFTALEKEDTETCKTILAELRRLSEDEDFSEKLSTEDADRLKNDIKELSTRIEK